MIRALQERQVDHINHNTLDNRRENLEIVTNRGNANNRRCQSKYGPGIRYNSSSKRFVARARVYGSMTHIGCYGTVEEATVARKAFLVRIEDD